VDVCGRTEAVITPTYHYTNTIAFFCPPAKFFLPRFFFFSDRKKRKAHSTRIHQDMYNTVTRVQLFLYIPSAMCFLLFRFYMSPLIFFDLLTISKSGSPTLTYTRIHACVAFMLLRSL